MFPRTSKAVFGVGFLLKMAGPGAPLARTNSGVKGVPKSVPNQGTENAGKGLPETRDSLSEEKGHGMLAPFTPGSLELEKSPLIIARSKGIYVYDEQGKEYIDALAGLWCTALGGDEPRLVEAAEKQLRTLPFYHSFWNRATAPALELASVLIDLFKPTKIGKVFFTGSGSESNDTQVKLVWFYNNALGRPLKKKFIAREKAYHGVTYVSASLSGLPAMHHSFDISAEFVLRADCPHYWRYHLPGESEEDFATRLADNLERLILKEGADTIAAFIAEPVMGAGGVIPPPKTYFEKVQKILKKYDILFIADEVVTAFGRLGTMFGSEYYNLKPDLVSLAKALSSAYVPIGAVLISEPIAEVIAKESKRLGNFGHGFTYSGHPVAAAVSLEAIRIYKERDIPGHVKKVSPVFQNGMRALSDSPIIGEIRGLELIMAVEFAADKKGTPFPAAWAVGTRFMEFCAQDGLLVRVAGDTIMLSPHLIITEDEIKKFVEIFERGLRKTEKLVASLQAEQNGGPTKQQ